MVEQHATVVRKNCKKTRALGEVIRRIDDVTCGRMTDKNTAVNTCSTVNSANNNVL